MLVTEVKKSLDWRKITIHYLLTAKKNWNILRRAFSKQHTFQILHTWNYISTHVLTGLFINITVFGSMAPCWLVISLNALIASRAVQDQQSTRLPAPCTDVRYGSGHFQALEGSGSILDPIAIDFFLCIKPFRALCHYNLVTGTIKQSYSNLNY